MTLFLFVGERVLSIADRRTASVPLAGLGQYFRDVKVYAAACYDAKMLAGDCYRIVDRTDPIDRRPIDDLLLKQLRVRQTEKWPYIKSFSEAIAESVQYPAYFLVGCGFNLQEAAAVCIAAQASSELDRILSAPYPRTVGMARDRWREAVLASRLFGGFVHSLIGYLEAISAGEKQLASLRNRVFGTLPVLHDYLLWATIGLMIGIAAGVRRSGLKSESDGIMEYIAIVLGPESGTIRNLAASRQQLNEWARHNPEVKFERPSVGWMNALSPGRAVERLTELLGPYEGDRVIPSMPEIASAKGKMEVTPQYRQYVLQVFLSPAIMF